MKSLKQFIEEDEVKSKVKHHQDQLIKLSVLKGTKFYNKDEVKHHENELKKYRSVKETKEKSKSKSTKRAVRNNSDAKRDSMRAGRRNYGQGKGK